MPTVTFEHAARWAKPVPNSQVILSTLIRLNRTKFPINGWCFIHACPWTRENDQSHFPFYVWRHWGDANGECFHNEIRDSVESAMKLSLLTQFHGNTSWLLFLSMQHSHITWSRDPSSGIGIASSGIGQSRLTLSSESSTTQCSKDIVLIR